MVIRKKEKRKKEKRKKESSITQEEGINCKEKV